MAGAISPPFPVADPKMAQLCVRAILVLRTNSLLRFSSSSKSLQPQNKALTSSIKSPRTSGSDPTPLCARFALSGTEIAQNSTCRHDRMGAGSWA
eukprot:2986103-Rhodomonas_salina.1